MHAYAATAEMRGAMHTTTPCIIRGLTTLQRLQANSETSALLFCCKGTLATAGAFGTEQLLLVAT
jgi:hypothetical protein